ncbi:unnamed protein product [Periconia digitata]|uniref:Uncharacterized protein n=1 Tax=Periconia digitata TaxID=1303443 RepID=A0A9W4UKC2_9PLEO|nr:unnamed protein product [Periconia digitata]
MKPPIIRVDDWEELPALATLYVCGDNVLDVDEVFLTCKNLLSHPGSGQILVFDDADTQLLSVRECKPEFLKLLFTCFANIVDYFADFAHSDSLVMQSIWYDMLDDLQTVAERLPHMFWEPNVPSCEHSKEFAMEYLGILKLINDVISPPVNPGAEKAVHHNKEHIERTNVRLGSFKAGLKPWGQFLHLKSPGFGVPYGSQISDKSARMGVEFKEERPEQTIPMGGLAIVDRHTERGRRLVTEVFRGDTEVDARRSEENMIREYDAHAVDLSENFITYKTLDGRQMTAEKMHPLSGERTGPRRYSGLGDPATIVKKPDFNLLDEHIGSLRGDDAYEHPDGNEQRQFHMLSIRTMPNAAPADDSVMKESDYTEPFDVWPES